MAHTPLVSVVMGAFNAAQDLPASVAGILGQTGVDLELIVVNDGSTDGTSALLHSLDDGSGRLRVIDKPRNQGLTQALIDGCNLARGELIARQDSDDLSLPGRLTAQAAFLQGHPEAVMVSCGTRFVGPRGEELFCETRDGGELHEGLQREQPTRLRGATCHGSAMFRRAAYEAAGGYRAEFRIAQDVDLWVRLSEVGRCLGMPEVLYEASWRPGSISHLFRDLQVRALETIVESRRLQRNGQDDGPLIQGFAAAVDEARSRSRGRRVSGRERAGFSYFVGSTLSGRDDRAARDYFREALQSWPLHWRAWARWGLCSLRLLVR